MEWDAIVVGAGPAGLTAALYLARFRRRVLVLHDGTARADWIPCTHNVPGFPDGIAGPELLARMRTHAERYGAEIRRAHVASAVRGEDDRFRLAGDAGEAWESRALILATGARLNQVPMDRQAHDAGVEAGTLRYCPICDGEEHAGQRIAVVGCDSSGAAEALFLRTWSEDVTLVPLSFAALGVEERAQLRQAGVRVIEAPLDRLEPRDGGITVHLQGSKALDMDVVYPALGTEARSRLASALGVETAEGGCVGLRGPFGTSVPGLWAAGDLVEGLDQISVAMGHGALAATRAHNWLRAREGMVLAP